MRKGSVNGRLDGHPPRGGAAGRAARKAGGAAARRELAAGGCLFVMALLGALLAISALGGGCAPRTDLFGEAATGDGEPGGGSAAGVLVDPQAGSTGVPSNLAAVVARLPAAIALDAAAAGGAGFRLRQAEGDPVAAALGPPVAIPCAAAAVAPAGSCYRVPLMGVLQLNRTYLFEVLPGVIETGGAAAATGVIGAFDTGGDADRIAPQVIDFSVALAGPCAGIRFTTDEPVGAQIVLRTDAGETVIPAGEGQTAFDLAVPFGGLAAGARAEIVLRVTDRAGNPTESSAGEIDVPLETPPLVITEVLANPAGPEPGQEFVELRNIGEAEVSLGGLRIEDAKGADVLPEAVLPPGAYALVVPSAFDPGSTRDVAPRAGTLMIPLDARIGSDGLSNAGEVVRLRMPGTAAEPIVSIYGGWVDVSAASAAGKSAHRLDDHACDHVTAWTRPPRPPTPGWGVP